MEKIYFSLLWGVSWCVGKMPLKAQFALGDILYVFLYSIFGYRKKVVRENLSNSFPGKEKNELRLIERQFYKHLADVFVETIALASMKREELSQRMKYINPEVLSDSRPTICAMAHFGSWEYTINFNAVISPRPVLAVYHPLSQQAAERMFFKMRSRFGTRPVPMAMTAKEILVELRKGKNPLVALIADQTPPRSQIKEWFDFLNQPTGFFNGMEKLALRLNMEIVFARIEKTSRGHYTCHFTKIYDGVESVEENEITRRYVKSLEDLILHTPSQWMWSHRRWKHKRLDQVAD